MDLLGLEDIRRRLHDVESMAPPVCGHSDVVEDVAARVQRLSEVVDAMVGDHKRLQLAIDEGIQKVNRAERRIRSSVSRARKQLAELGLEDPMLEGEAGEIRDDDGDGSENGRVRLVPPEVGGDPQTPSTIKGVSVEMIRRVRGM